MATYPLRGWLRLPYLSLDAAGIVALADLDIIGRRTAFTGTSCLLDILVLCPGMHRQKYATELNKGEYPACAALTTGYVFRVENPATVLYLQKMGRTGHLTTVSVQQITTRQRRWLSALYTVQSDGMVARLAYFLAICCTVSMLCYSIISQDWWLLFNLGILALSRACNACAIRFRSRPGWFGEPEPGVKGELLVLLSQDRWIRIQGLVDDLKAITSGQWLREESWLERGLTAFATLLVYLDAALVSNAFLESKMLLIILLMSTAALLGLVNESTTMLQMHNRIVQAVGTPKAYKRRLDLANEMIQETGRRDWAIRLGMVHPSSAQEAQEEAEDGLKTM